MAEKEKTNSGNKTVIFFLILFFAVCATYWRSELISLALRIGISTLLYVNHQGRMSNIVKDALALIFSISLSWISGTGIHAAVVVFAFWYIFDSLVTEREEGKALMPLEKESSYAPSTKKKKPKK